MMSHDVVLLSTADWDNPFWTNKQHVAVELARLGHRVLYIDSLGLRRPSASASDLKRMRRRVLKALRPPRKVRDNLWVWSPMVLPWHGHVWVRAINRLLLRTGLRVWLGLLRFKHDILWTYNPLTTELLDLKSFKQRVYHCVDEIKAQPGMPVQILEHAEETLTRQVDIVFTTSPQLTQTRGLWNKRTHYLPNVADFMHFSKAMNADTIVPDDLLAIPAPRLGFIGAISGYKIDFGLLRHIAKAKPNWSLVLIGAVGEGDPWTDKQLLEGLPNVHLLGPRDYQALPGYLKGFDVSLLPNHVNDYTDAMFPMKFFEYLAAGCPVVSVDLKAIREFADIVAVGKSPDEFITQLDKVLSGAAPPLEQRLAVARQYTYEARTKTMLEMIEGAGRER